MENAPDSLDEVVDILAKSGYLKVENDKVKISLESSDTINIQPTGTIFGAKIKVEEDGSITPTVTFDTKKTREKGKFTPPDKIVDNAIDDWEKNNDEIF